MPVLGSIAEASVVVAGSYGKSTIAEHWVLRYEAQEVMKRH